MARSPEAPTGGAGGRRGSSWRAAGAALVAVLALVGTGMLGTAMLTASPPPPQPAVEAAPAATDPDPDLGSTPSPRASEVGLPRSEPTKIAVPRIGVDAKIMSLGLQPDGTLEVPPLKQAQLAGWYRLGPSPGEIGNSVIVGHVDSRAMGPAVFYSLGALRKGDDIQVTRKDRTVARFRVDSVQSHPKQDFPTELVYGPSRQAGLRLVTCGGQFDSKKRTYLNNIVVLATLVR